MTSTLPAASVSRQVWAIRVIFGANGALFATWVSRIPAIRDRLEADERGLGFALLFIAVGSLIAMPMSGRMVSRWGARVVLAVCVVVCLVAYPLLGIVPNLVLLSAVLLVVGAGVGVWDVAMNVAGHAVEESAGRTLMPGFHACWSIGTVVGAGAGALAARAGVPPAMHFTIACAAVAVAAVFAIRAIPQTQGEAQVEDSAGEHHVPPSRERSLVRDPRLVGLGLMTLCAAWAEGSANDWLALFMADDRDASGALAAAGFAVFATAMTLGRLTGNQLVARFGRLATLRWGAVVATVGVVVVLTVPSLPAAYVGALLWGFGIASAFPLAMTSAGETPGRGPSAIAMVATIAYTGFLVGPPLIGTVAHATSLNAALWVVVGLTLGMLALAGTARPMGSRVRG